jgi:chromosome segregation ATPase
VLYLEEAQNKQKSNAATITDLDRNINEVRREIETTEERRQVLKSEFHQLETEKADLQLDLEQKIKREKERIEPEIKNMITLIAEINNEIVENETRIQKEEENNKDIEEKIVKMETKKDSLRDEIDTLNAQHRKERDEPERLEKANINLTKAVDHV